jgi:hypothetical protein
MANVRNPIASLLLTMAAASGLAAVVSIPVLLLPLIGLQYFELHVFYLAFAAFGIGVVSGRASFLGSMGFAGALIGGFAGFFLFQWLLWPTGWEFLLSLALGASCGLGGLASGKLGVRRVQRAIQELPELRRCQRCGSRVGLSARRCWSCKAYLPPI